MLKKLRVVAARLVCLALVLICGINSAQANRIYTNIGDLEAFLDGVMTTQLEQHRIPGAVIAVVHNDEILFAKGYGYANLEREEKVTVNTLFRVGSISKLFVWTAVMQLYQEGLLALDEDINTYLDFSIPDTLWDGSAAEPITMRHLMSHTAGFEDQNLGLFVLAEKDLQPLGEYLENAIPARIFPPGQISAYSNYGSSLAAYIVERISGMPFLEYVEEYIFTPLGMKNSTFRQPVPEQLAKQLSAGYRSVDGIYRLGDFELCQSYPAGSLSASGLDMAKFMSAYLSEETNGQYILNPETKMLMHSQSFSHHPELPGMAHGFIEMKRNGHRLISHTGDTLLFHSGLYLLPDEHLGIFVSFNGANASTARDYVFKAFMNRYFADETTVAMPSTDLMERAAQVSGSFHLSRSNYTETEAIFRLLNPIKIAVDQDGCLVARVGTSTNRYIPTDSGVFRSLDGGSSMYPVTDGTGKVIQYYTDSPGVLLRTPWYATTEFALLLGGVSLLVFLGTIIRWALLLVKRQTRRITFTRPAVFVVTLLTLAQIGFYVLLFTLVGNVHPVYGIPMVALEPTPALGYVQLVSWVYAVLTAAITLIALNQIRKRMKYLKPLLYSILSQGFVFLLYYWNFL